MEYIGNKVDVFSFYGGVNRLQLDAKALRRTDGCLNHRTLSFAIDLKLRFSVGISAKITTAHRSMESSISDE